MYLGKYTGHGHTVEVPDIAGMYPEEASVLFAEVGLEYLVVDSIYSPKGKGGMIVEQNPFAGQQVKQGRMVYLTTYRWESPQEVVDIEEGESLKIAAIRLKNKEISYEVEYEPNVLLSGRVIRVLHNGKVLPYGHSVRRGETLQLIVGQTGAHSVIVPDLLGLSWEGSKSTLQEASLALGSVFFDGTAKNYEDSLQARVYRQNPKGDGAHNTPTGTLVDVWLTLNISEVDKIESEDYNLQP